ncbi:SAM-dependent methyltransferase [Halosegnis rubeus]|uniref:SAM-dependent methyltransferase n=1 Tax=Halosegnis rubeus TaxID=2212850 RepID=A0A5N5U8H5_9EURY|nr:SAM-dependent methyltransferase [Halosegnis rubeus]
MTADGHDHGQRRYLTAKHSVDERARNDRVRRRLLAELPATPRVVEWGPGVGLSVPTLTEWTSLDSYHGVETDPRLAAFARSLVSRLFARREAELSEMQFTVGDALATETEPCDLLYAQSFFDLVSTAGALDAVEERVAAGGVAYAPLTFDGKTTFLPRHHDDETVLGAFHDTIDATDGQSRAATTLIDALGERDATVLAVGSSDWMVRPHAGEYPADERYFLSSILDIIEDALGEHAAGWLAARRAQLAEDRLTYVANNHDVVWRP